MMGVCSCSGKSLHSRVNTNKHSQGVNLTPDGERKKAARKSTRLTPRTYGSTPECPGGGSSRSLVVASHDCQEAQGTSASSRPSPASPGCPHSLAHGPFLHLQKQQHCVSVPCPSYTPTPSDCLLRPPSTFNDSCACTGPTQTSHANSLC